MLKRIFCACIFFVLILSTYGCQKDTNVGEKINPVQQKETVTTSKVDDNSNSATNNNNNSVASNNNNSVASNNSNSAANNNSNSAANEKYNLKDYMNKSEKIILTGKINKDLSIHMELEKTNKAKFDDLSDRYYDSNMSMQGDAVETRYEGTYYYDKYMKNIRVEAQAYANGYINIFEFNDNNQVSGSFGGFIFQDKILKGMWNDNNEPKYPFYLVKGDANINGIDLSIDTSRTGKYSRTGNTSNNSTTLIIYSTSNDKIKFHINGYSKPNIGDIGGVATYTDKSKKTAEFYDKQTNLKITFEFDGNSIKVVGNDVLSQFAGAHVTMSGTFVK